jgi:hypothetical protein
MYVRTSQWGLAPNVAKVWTVKSFERTLLILSTNTFLITHPSIRHKTVKMADRPVKFTITHYRLPQHTHEAFIKWIVEVHLPKAMPVFKKYGVIEYSLVSASY